jgi:hypothetical protein
MVSQPGVVRGRERRCLNRALNCDVAVMAKMSPYHGAPRPACVRAPPRTDGRSVACTAHVRRNGGEVRGTRASMHCGVREPGEGARPRSAVASGGARARRRGATSRRRARLAQIVLMCLSLNVNNPKILNRSLPNVE